MINGFAVDPEFKNKFIIFRILTKVIKIDN